VSGLLNRELLFRVWVAKSEIGSVTSASGQCLPEREIFLEYNKSSQRFSRIIPLPGPVLQT
jgi:hypothetical protein